MTFHRTKKIISFLATFFFLVSNFAWAVPEQKNTFEIKIPSELGSIKNIFYPSDSSQAPFVIHIQTTHANYETALKVEKIIRNLRARYGVKLLLVEGGSGRLHPELLNFFPDPALNRKFLDALAQKGELTGADLALSNSRIQAFGIESPDFYWAAFQNFKKVINNLNQSEKFMEDQKKKLDRRASQIFSPEFRDLLQTWQKFQANQRDFAAAVKFLKKEAQKALDIDFENPFSQFDWPQLTRFTLLQELEKQVNPSSLQKEKEKLGGWLKQEKIVSEFITLLDSSQTTISRDAYQNFLAKTYPLGFRFKDYPQITYKAAFQILRSELDTPALLGELGTLFGKLFAAKALKKEEIELLKQYKELLLLQRLLHLELNSEEWKNVKHLLREGELKIRNPGIKDAFHFYELSERREEIFYHHLSKEMKEQGQRIAILMTGGFHAEGMSRIFKEKKVGYASIVPHLSEAGDHSLYHEIMLGRAHLDKPGILQLAGAGTLTDEAYLRAELRTVTDAFEQWGGKVSEPEAPAYFQDRWSFFNSRSEMRRTKKSENWKTVFINSKIKNGKRIGGKSVGGFLRLTSRLLTRYPDQIVTNVVSSPSGKLRVYGKLLLTKVAKGKQFTVVIEKGKFVKIYDEKGRPVPFWGDPEAPFAVFRNAVIRKGKLAGGEFVRSYLTRLGPKFLQKNKNVVVTNIPLNAAGGLRLSTYIWTSKKGYENYKGALMIVKDGNVVKAYDRVGHEIYDQQTEEKMKMKFYAGAIYRDGKIVGGRFIGLYETISKWLLKKYPDGVATNASLDYTGGLHIGGETFWHTLPGYEYAKGITIVFRNSEVAEVYDRHGKRFRAEGAEAFFESATIVEGKRVGGRLVGYIRSLDKEFLRVHPDGVYYRKFPASGLMIHGSMYVLPKPEYVETIVAILLKGGKVQEIYDAKGKKIYPTGEGDRNAFYIRAQLRDGKRMGGEFVGSFPGGITKKELKKYPDVMIGNIEFNDMGGFSIAGFTPWMAMKGYESAKGNLAVVRKGKLIAVYDRPGRFLYGQDVENPERVSRNALFINATVINGKLQQGEFVRAGRFSRGAFRKLKKAVIKNAKFNNSASMTIGGIVRLRKAGYENADGILLVVEGGKIVEAFDKEGHLIRSTQEASDAASAAKFQRLVENKDLENLLHNFGIEGTYRILLRLHQFTPVTLKELLGLHLLQGESFTKLEALALQLRKTYSFVRTRRIHFPDTLPRDFEEVLADEIIQAVYASVVQDSRFLKDLLHESQNPQNSAVLQNAYRRVYEHYRRKDKKALQGINENAITLKFYQLTGIDFLLGKKRAILADEPGLGKTIQAIAAALNIRDGQGAKKILIVAPKSARNIWKNEIKRYTKGNQKIALILRGRVPSARKKREVEKARFVIVNYDLIRDQASPLMTQIRATPFDIIIADEAHRMRNESLQAKALSGLEAEYKFLITGTPLVGRNIIKIYNLVHWLHPELFPSRKEFMMKYGGGERGVLQLKEDLRRFLIRRVKANVAEIPPKNYINIPVPLNAGHRDIYQRIWKNFKGWVESQGNSSSSSKTILLTKLIRLRQAAVDPKLVDPSSSAESSKYPVLDSVIQEIEKRGEKAVIFTNHVPVVKTLVRRYRGKSVFRLIGQMPMRDREKEITDFRRSSKPAIFISTPAGGEAISLVSETNVPANNVIFLDKPWTPQQRNQMTDRIHRIGQTHPIWVYSLIAPQTIDEHIESVLTYGDLLFQLLLEDDPSAVSLDKRMIEFVLKKLSYSIETIKKVKSYKKRDQKKTKKAEKSSTTKVRQDGLWIQFDGKDFSAVLRGRKNEIFQIREMRDLITAADQLSEDSKGLFKEFLTQRLNDEIQRQEALKKSFLWQFTGTLTPVLNNIDYDPEVEQNVEVSSIILSLLLENEKLKPEDLQKYIGEEMVLNKALYFLDRNNLFLVLSRLGALNKNYYYDGDLLGYRAPLQGFAFDGRVSYVDEAIVEQIAVHRSVPLSAANNDNSFESEAKKYRKLSVEEEIRLAREIKKGNAAARAALYQANLRSVIATAEQVAKIIKDRMGDYVFERLDMESLFAIGNQELDQRLDKYSQAAEEMPFQEYAQPYIKEVIRGEAYKQARISRQERDVLDKQILSKSGKSVTLADKIAGRRSKGDEESPLEKSPALIPLASDILKSNGFQPDEVAIFLDFSEGESLDAIAKKYSVSHTRVRDIIDTAKEDLKTSPLFLETIRDQFPKNPRSEMRNIQAVYPLVESKELGAAVLLGVTSNTLKDMMRGDHGLKNPMAQRYIVVLPPKLFDGKRSFGELEFLVYYYAYVAGALLKPNAQPLQVVGTAEQLEALKELLGHTIFGPEWEKGAYQDLVEQRALRPEDIRLFKSLRDHYAPRRQENVIPVTGYVQTIPFDSEGLARVNIPEPGDITKAKGQIFIRQSEEIRRGAKGEGVGYSLEQTVGNKAVQPLGNLRVNYHLPGPKQYVVPEEKKQLIQEAKDGFARTWLGTSTGFDPAGDTTSLILWLEGQGIWVDPSHEALEYMDSLSITEQDVPYILLTHIHQDHDSGVLRRILLGQQVTLIASSVVYRELLQKAKLFLKFNGGPEAGAPPDVNHLIHWIPLDPGWPLKLKLRHGGKAVLKSWWNLHTIPTNGFSVTYKAEGAHESFTYAHSSDTQWGRAYPGIGDNDFTIEKNLEKPGKISTKEARRQQYRFFTKEGRLKKGIDFVDHEAGGAPIHTAIAQLAALSPETRQQIALYHVSDKAIADYNEQHPAAQLHKAGMFETKIFVPADPGKKRQYLLSILISNALLRGKSADFLRVFQNLAMHETYPKGHPILVQGRSVKVAAVQGLLSISGESSNEDAGRVYFILSGRAGVYVNDKKKTELLPGSQFGEMSILTGQPRSATIIAEGPLEVYSLSAQNFLALFGEKSTQNRVAWMRENLNLLTEWVRRTTSSMFRDLPNFALGVLADEVEERSYSKGEDIINEGEKGNEFFIVKEGEVEIIKASDPTHPLAGGGRGYHFGEVALLRNTPRTATVRAKTAVKVLVIQRSTFQNLIQHYPALFVRLDHDVEAHLLDLSGRFLADPNVNQWIGGTAAPQVARVLSSQFGWDGVHHLLAQLGGTVQRTAAADLNRLWGIGVGTESFLIKPEDSSLIKVPAGALKVILNRSAQPVRPVTIKEIYRVLAENGVLFLGNGLDPETFENFQVAGFQMRPLTPSLYEVKKPASRKEAVALHLKYLGISAEKIIPPIKPEPAAAKAWTFPEEFIAENIDKIQTLAAMLQESVGIHVMPSANLDLLGSEGTYAGTAYILNPEWMREQHLDTDREKARQFLETFAHTFLESFHLGFEARRNGSPTEPSVPVTLFVRTGLRGQPGAMEPFHRDQIRLHQESRALFEERLGAVVKFLFEEIHQMDVGKLAQKITEAYLDALLKIAKAAGIKPVSYLWRKVLEENQVSMNGTIVEVAPGYETKIGDALAFLNFKGTILLIEPDPAAAAAIREAYQRLLPQATVRVIEKRLEDIQIGVDVPLHVDALVANHPFDDMALASAMSSIPPSFFSEERRGGEAVSPDIKQLYDNVSDKDYIRGILNTITVWRNFIRQLKPDQFIASQYPSRKLMLKGLAKRQNSGFIIIELLREFYEEYLKAHYEIRSFGRQGDPAWWIIAREPYSDLAHDLAKKPEAIGRLGEPVFAPQHTRRLDPSEYQVGYVDGGYFTTSGYGGEARKQAENFAIAVEREIPTHAQSLITYADRQKDGTQISLGGNLGSGRAVYFGDRFNVMGAGKTTLATSLLPSHRSGRLESVGAFRRVILSKWINSLVHRVMEHPVVILLKETETFKWNPTPIPLALLVRVDEGSLDRPNHVEQSPDIPVDFSKALTEYAKLDAEYFAYRLMMGAWSTGNYSLDGHMIDLETASFVKYRGPYSTASTKYAENFFGYEGMGFVRVLRQLAIVKGLAADQIAGIEQRFYEIRRRHLAQCFLMLLGLSEETAAVFFSKHPEEVMTLADEFERLSKKISPRRTSLNLYQIIPEEEDPTLLDMSRLFRNLATLQASASARESRALDILVRQSALAQVQPGIVYEPQLTRKGEINRGEIFIKEHAVVSFNQRDEFMARTQNFVARLFRLIDQIEAENFLPKKSDWERQLQTANQNFPTFAQLNEKLKYWVEEYRLRRIGPETLGLEIERLSRMPHYPSGKNYDLEDAPLIKYLNLSGKKLKNLAQYFQVADYAQGDTIIRQGEDADALYLLVQGLVRFVVNGQERGTISHRGAMIGEAAVLGDTGKRAATVLAEAPTRLLKIEKEKLEQVLEEFPDLKRLLANVLTQKKYGAAHKVLNLEVFSGIDTEELRLFLADKAVEKKFQKGTPLIQQGEKAEGIYFLAEGSVVLSQTGTGLKTEPIQLGDGPVTTGSFGGQSVLFGRGAVNTVTANEDVAALFLSRDNFSQLLDRHPGLLRSFLSHIAEHLRADQERISRIASMEKKLEEPNPRSELRAAVRISGLEVPFLKTDLSGINFMGQPFKWITILGVGGILESHFRFADRAALEKFIISVVSGKSPQRLLAEAAVVQDASRDGLEIPQKQKAGPSPVILQVDSKALDPKDRASIEVRLMRLPAGSVVIEYVDFSVSESNILSSLVRRFPHLHYFRKGYQRELRIDLARQELARRAKEYGIPPENAGFLAADLKIFSGGKDLLSSLGVVFQFDPAKLSRPVRLLGLSGAILGELAEYAKLDRQVRDRVLAEAQSHGLFGLGRGAYSFNLDLWLESRQAFSAAA